MGKYDPLGDYLAGLADDKVRESMTFGQIAQLVGPLPASARMHRAWWGNNDSNVEARAWLSAGWRVESLNQDAETVVFARSRTRTEAQTWPLLDEDFVVAGRYRVERLLGKGERKYTYLACDLKGRRQVALAVIAAGTGSGTTEREAAILGPVHQHANIVTLYDFEAESGREYMVFEYLPGGDLAAYCRELRSRNIRIALPDFFRLARQLCRALSHIHSHGIVHRDVSLGNIWLDERGDAHLGDFDTATSAEYPLPDSGVSTFEGFAAPEMQANGPVDARADIYSLGAILYEVLTAISPPMHDDLTSMTLVAPSRLRDDLPAGMDRLILSMLSIAPDRRPASAAAVLDALHDMQRRASDVAALLTDGESGTVEFKASLRTDVPGGKLNKVLEQVVVKSVAGFLNGRGGTLLIGVADDGTPVGLDSDYASSANIGGRDGFERHLRELLSSTSGRHVQPFVTVTFHRINGRDICRVAVEPSDRPVYVKT